MRVQATAKQLAEALPDVPQATLYRNLTAMTQDGILKVASERKVRGTIEKSYAVINPDCNLMNEKLAENNGEVYFQIFANFIAGLMREFKEYTAKDKIDIVNDGSGFSVAPLYLTKEELAGILTKFNELAVPHLNNKPGGSRRLYSIATIITPPKAADNI